MSKERDRLPVLRPGQELPPPTEEEREAERQVAPMRQYEGRLPLAREDERSPVTEVVWCPLSEAEHEALTELLATQDYEPGDVLRGALDGMYAGFTPARESKLVGMALQAVRERKQHGGLR